MRRPRGRLLPISPARQDTKVLSMISWYKQGVCLRHFSNDMYQCPREFTSPGRKKRKEERETLLRQLDQHVTERMLVSLSIRFVNGLSALNFLMISLKSLTPFHPQVMGQWHGDAGPSPPCDSTLPGYALDLSTPQLRPRLSACRPPHPELRAQLSPR
jgi:hypothetical protein